MITATANTIRPVLRQSWSLRAAALLAVIGLTPPLVQGGDYSTRMAETNKTGVFRDFVNPSANHEVDGNVMLFWDWRWVYPGYPDWTAPPGVRVGLMTTGSTDPMPSVLLATIATPRAEHIPGETFGVQAHQNIRLATHITQNKCQVFLIIMVIVIQV